MKFLEINESRVQNAHFLAQVKEKYLYFMNYTARSRSELPKRVLQWKVRFGFFAVFSFSTSFFQNSRDQSSVASLASKMIFRRFSNAAVYEYDV